VGLALRSRKRQSYNYSSMPFRPVAHGGQIGARHWRTASQDRRTQEAGVTPGGRYTAPAFTTSPFTTFAVNQPGGGGGESESFPWPSQR
jgi:uncharacterized membrane protein